MAQQHGTEPERDEITGTETTGHQWDGIKELNTPLPRWWLWTFYATVVWAFGYMILYPAIPLITKASGGILGYSSRADVDADVAAAKADQAVFVERVDQASLEEIRADQDLFQYAVAGGRSAFAVNCMQCHGSGAQGFPGYPNLNDDEWLWGGTPEDIYATIAHGIRYDGDDDTRYSMMPAFGRDGILGRDEVALVTDYVLSLTGEAEATPEGEELYLDNCSACHGEDGGGDRMQGAPALNDAIWLYGGDRDTVMESVSNARFGVMPGWNDRLEDATIKKLAIYVHALGGGE